MIAPLIFLALAIVFVGAERKIKSWGIRVILGLFVLSLVAGVAFNLGTTVGDASARNIMMRELDDEFDRFETSLNTNEVSTLGFKLKEFRRKVPEIIDGRIQRKDKR